MSIRAIGQSRLASLLLNSLKPNYKLAAAFSSKDGEDGEDTKTKKGNIKTKDDKDEGDEIMKGFVLKESDSEKIKEKLSKSVPAAGSGGDDGSDNGDDSDDLKPFHEIPGFREVPFFGSIPFLLMRSDFRSNHFFEFWRNIHEEMGQIVRLTFPYGKLISLKHPDDIKKVYEATHGKKYEKNPHRQAFLSLKKIRMEDPFYEGKTGILSENGEEWYRVRRIAQKPLLTVRSKQFIPEMDRIAVDFVERISGLAALNIDGMMPENFLREIFKFTMENGIYIILNRRFGCLELDLTKKTPQTELIETIDSALKAFEEAETGLPFWKYGYETRDYSQLKINLKDLLNFLDKEVTQIEKKIVSEGRSKGNVPYMEYLLDSELSRKDVLTLGADLLLGSINTTSYAIVFLLYLLSKNPLVQRRLQEEIDEIVPNADQPITDSDLTRFRYLKCCIKEALRLYTVTGGALRLLTKDLALRGYHIPAGTNVFLNLELTGKEKKWFEEPDRFYPERWLPKAEPDVRPWKIMDQEKPKMETFAFQPFSIGPRTCIGRRTAEQQMWLLTARIFKKYNVFYDFGELKTIWSFVLAPKGSVQFNFIERNK